MDDPMKLKERQIIAALIATFGHVFEDYRNSYDEADEDTDEVYEITFTTKTGQRLFLYIDEDDMTGYLYLRKRSFSSFHRHPRIKECLWRSNYEGGIFNAIAELLYDLREGKVAL